MTTKCYFIFCIEIFLGICTGSEFVYPENNQVKDFPKWGGICDTGINQSPIDLDTRQSVVGYFDDFKFHNYDEPLKGAVIENNGHTVKLSFNNCKPSISRGGLPAKYELEQIHFHWHSEHSIDGEIFPFETHLVHRNMHYTNLSEALKHKDGLAVLGVLHYVSTSDDMEISNIVSVLDEIASVDNKNVKKALEMEIFPSYFLPSDASTDYFRYYGSLTTPPCSESVIWTVYLKSKSIALDQVQAFKNIEFKEGVPLGRNNRITQNIGPRTIVLVSNWPHLDSNSRSASSFFILESTIVLFTANILLYVYRLF